MLRLITYFFLSAHFVSLCFIQLENSELQKKILLGNGCLKHDQIINKEIKSSYFGCYYVFISWQFISLFDLCNSSSLVRSWPWCSPCWCTVKFCVLRSTWTDCRTAVDWPEMERPIANCSGISIYSPNQTIVL